MARTKSVVLTPAERKAALIEARAALKEAKTAVKAHKAEVKAYTAQRNKEEKAHTKTAKELESALRAAQNKVDSLTVKSD